MPKVYNLSADEALKFLKTTTSGLSQNEVTKRQEEYGKNVIKVPGEPLWRKIIEPFASVFMLVLIIAAVISLVQDHALDAAIIAVIISINATIYYVQRFSTERILRSLQKHTSQAVNVLRDGELIQVDASELVPGDIVHLNEGDRVPADLRLLDGSSVRADESLLTGESVPISKFTHVVQGEKEVYERGNTLFQGSFLVSGTAVSVVESTGDNTEFGKIAVLSAGINTESPVQRKIDRLISHIIAVISGIAIVAFVLALYRGMEMAEAFRFVLALSVSAVPESLPIALSVILVLGMRRMAARKALVRNMRAIETVGVLTTIATDKTGTLTKNKLSVQETWVFPGTNESISSVANLSVNGSAEKTHDPLDTAIIEYVRSQDSQHKHIQPLVSLPFDQSVAMSGNIHPKDQSFMLYIKGAPENVLDRSGLTEEQHTSATHALDAFTKQGYRVIAIAKMPLSAKIKSFADIKGGRLEFVGFLAVADTLRPEAKKAVSAALGAGVTVRMITGDHFETAYHIASQLGMVSHRNQAFDSRKMKEMSDDELEKVIQDVRVFSRVTPEHKFRILSILKKNNITAMTGDGVNDVPALSNAHVGFAMGSGSQMAKDAGDVILLDDNFRSIVTAIHEGRIIFANVRRMLLYLLSTNAGEVITMITALVVGIPLPILPVQILWINIATDTCLVIPLGLEPGNKFTLKQKPNKVNSPIISKFLISRMILMATTMAAITLTIFTLFYESRGFAYANTLAFNALVVMQWANAMNVRSSFQSIVERIKVMNKAFFVGLTIAISIQLLALFGPLQKALRIIPVDTIDLVVTGLAAFIIPLLVVEIHKLIGRKYFRPLA